MKPFAETSYCLFDENKKMRQGNQKVRFFNALMSTVHNVIVMDREYVHDSP